MSAEQQTYHFNFLRKFKEFFRPQVIEQFSAYKIYEKFEQDLKSVDLEEARRRRLALLETNLKTYVQEATGDQTIFPYATRVIRISGRIVLQNLQYQDVEQQQRENLEKEPNKELRRHYQKEHILWNLVWNQLIDEIIEQVGNPNRRSTEQALLAKGAKRKTLNLPTTQEAGSFKFNMDSFSGLKRLFPSLAMEESIEILELPKKIIFTSPSYEFYHDGQTTLGRHVRLVYVPLIHEFVLLAEGLFTGYEDVDIAKLHLFGQEKKLPQTKEELFWNIQVLAEDYAEVAPHALFEELIKLIGRFDPPPVGEGVVMTQLLQRDLSTQIEYLERIFEIESDLCQKDPLRRSQLPLMMREATGFVMQTALRDKAIDVELHINNYLKSFSHLPRNMHEVRETFIRQTIGFHPDFATRVVSLVDCGTGTVLGAPNMLNQLRAFELAGVNLSTTQEVLNFCRQFNLDNPARFSELGQCAMCGEKNVYIWPREEGGCNVCPVCEAKDNLRMKDSFTEYDSNPNSSVKNLNKVTDFGAPIGVSQLINSFTGVNYL